MKYYSALIILCFSMSTHAVSSKYDSVFITVGSEYGVDPVVLKAIAYHESRLEPYATNINGESFFFKSLNEALSSLRHAAVNPWMIKIRVKRNGSYKTGRRFFSSKAKMDKSLNEMISRRRLNGLKELKVSSKQSAGSSEYIMARKLNVNSTDIGISQINYRYHDNANYNVADWYNPIKNIRYQAELLSTLLKKHKTTASAVAHYHSGTKHLQQKYLARFKSSLSTVQKTWTH